MKTINKYFLLTIFTFLSLSTVYATNPPTTPVTCSFNCGKLDASWGAAAGGGVDYEIQIYKSGNPYTSNYLPVGANLSYTFPSNAGEVLEAGSYGFKVRAVSGGIPSTDLTPTYGISISYNSLNTTVSNISCKEFTISWNNLLTGCASNAVTYKYIITQYSTTCGTSGTDVSPTNNTTTNTSVTFTNAVPGYYYQVTVGALTYYTATTGATAGTSTYPSSGCFQTSTISNVTGLTLDNNSGTPANNYCNSFTAIWDKNTCATHYELKLYECDYPHYPSSCTVGTLISTVTVQGTSSANQSYPFNSGLTPGYGYRVEIRAIYKQGSTELASSGTVSSTNPSFIILPTVISAPGNVHIVSKCGRKVTIAWNASTDSRATGYMLDMSNDYYFTAGNFLLDQNTNYPIQDYNVPGGVSTTSIEITLASFSPFSARTIHLKIKTLNSNNSCNSGYSYVYNINLYETEASITPTWAYFGATEGSNTFRTSYCSFNFPHETTFRYDDCVTKVGLNIEMVNADGTLFTPASGLAGAIRSFTSTPTTNVSGFMYGPPILNTFITNNGGTICNYNGIGTSGNLTSSSTSFLLAPKIEYGSGGNVQLLSTGYHKITLLYWVGSATTPTTYSVIVRVFNGHDDFSLQYPTPGTTAPFTNYYFNEGTSASNNYHYGPGFQCRQFNATINASSNPPGISTTPYSSWDFVYPPYTKIIFSKASSPDLFYHDGTANPHDQIIGTKVLTSTEISQLRSGTLNLIDVFNSLNITGNISYIGIRTGTSYGSSPLTELTKIMAFGYTAKPTNVVVDYKCASDVSLKWTGSGNASGTVYLVTIGSSYNSTTNTITNYATSGSGGSTITYNNYQVTTNQLQSIFNAPYTTYYVQVKAQNSANGCTSDPSTVLSFTIYSQPLRFQTPSTICENDGVALTVDYDADCISKVSLRIENSTDATNYWQGSLEPISAFLSKLNTQNTDGALHPWLFSGGTIQNYINNVSANSSLWFGGYDGQQYLLPTGQLFKAFLSYSGSYDITISYTTITNGTPTDVKQNIAITYPNYPVTVRKSNGQASTNHSPREVPNIYSGQLEIDCYQNCRYLSITAPNNSTSCIGEAWVEFSNTNSGAPYYTPIFSGTSQQIDVQNALNTSPGLDVIGLAIGRGYMNNYSSVQSVYIRITYRSNGSHSLFGAVYTLNYYDRNGYPNSNNAYSEEMSSGFNDFSLFSDSSKIFTYNSVANIYFSGTDVLVPDLNSTIISSTNFYGYSGGSAAPNNFQWDNQVLGSSCTGVNYDSIWDSYNMFVSPMSNQTMNICQVLDISNYTGSCYAYSIINIPQVVYQYNPFTNGNYVDSGAYAVDNLIMNQGVVDMGMDTDYVIQQSAVDNSYCVQTYGIGWRLPTASEIGKEDDYPSMTVTTNPGYEETGTGNIWSSSLWQNNTSWWEASGVSGYTTIVTNNNYYNTQNYVRCVYPTR